MRNGESLFASWSEPEAREPRSGGVCGYRCGTWNTAIVTCVAAVLPQKKTQDSKGGTFMPPLGQCGRRAHDLELEVEVEVEVEVEFEVEFKSASGPPPTPTCRY